MPVGLILLSHVHTAEVEDHSRGNPLPFWQDLEKYFGDKDNLTVNSICEVHKKGASVEKAVSKDF
jgi:hypothetical protein